MKQKRKETKCLYANNGSQGLPAPPAQREVSELKLASGRNQMFKHLTPEILTTPNYAQSGFLGPNMGQAACVAQVPGTTTPLARKQTQRMCLMTRVTAGLPLKQS